jgi:hypothetical protein
MTVAKLKKNRPRPVQVRWSQQSEQDQIQEDEDEDGTCYFGREGGRTRRMEADEKYNLVV